MSIGTSPFQGGGSSSIADATETTAGKIRIATSTEASTGTNDTTAMTPLTVKERIDAAIVGGVEYKGTFNATAGTPSLTTAEKGDLYIVGTAGTIYGQTWAVGDHLLINDDMGGSISNSKIDKVDNTDDDASETVKGIIQIATSAEATTGTNDLKAMTPLTVKERIDALSLGTASTQDVGTSASNVVQLDGSAKLPAVDGSQLTNLPAGSAASETAAGIIEIATSAEATTGTDDLKAMTPLTVKERIDALSLGTASTQDVGTSANNVVQLDGSAKLPAVDGSQLTNLPAGSAASETAAGIIEIATSAEATTGTDDLKAMTPLTVKERIDALSLGTASTQDVGTSASNVVQLDGSAKLPAVDGSQLTNLPAGSAASETAAGIIEIATSAEATTGTDDLKAMTPLTVKERIDALSLGTASTQDVGTSASNVVQLDGSAKLPAVDGSQLTNLPSASDASETTKGIIEIATSAEATTGTDDLKAMTPLTVKERIDALSSTYQPLDSGLTSIAGLTTAADKMIFTDGSDSYDTTDLTAFARSFLDDANATTARSTLSLGSASTEDVGTSANNVVQLDGSAKLPAVDGSQLTNLPTASAASETAAGIIEIATSAEATTGTDDLKAMTPLTVKERIDALSLGTASTQDVGTSASNVVQLDGSAKLPAVDGSQLTNLPAGSAASETAAGIIEIATSAEATTGTDDLKAMTPLTVKERIDALSLGTASTQDVGTSANNVVQLDGSAKLPAVDGSQLTNLPSGGGGNATLNQETLSGDKTISTPSASRTIFVFTSSADRVINLPAASGLSSGQLVDIKSMSNVTFTITPNGTDKLDGSAGGTLALNVQYSSVTLVCDGTDDWFIV